MTQVCSPGFRLECSGRSVGKCPTGVSTLFQKCVCGANLELESKCLGSLQLYTPYVNPKVEPSCAVVPCGMAAPRTVTHSRTHGRKWECQGLELAKKAQI